MVAVTRGQVVSTRRIAADWQPRWLCAVAAARRDAGGLAGDHSGSGAGGGREQQPCPAGGQAQAAAHRVRVARWTRRRVADAMFMCSLPPHPPQPSSTAAPLVSALQSLHPLLSDRPPAAPTSPRGQKVSDGVRRRGAMPRWTWGAGAMRRGVRRTTLRPLCSPRAHQAQRCAVPPWPTLAGWRPAWRAPRAHICPRRLGGLQPCVRGAARCTCGATNDQQEQPCTLGLSAGRQPRDPGPTA